MLACKRPIPVVSVARPLRRPIVVVKAISPSEVVDASYYVGKGITLFAMFYCTMNWWMYKRINDEDQ